MSCRDARVSSPSRRKARAVVRALEISTLNGEAPCAYWFSVVTASVGGPPRCISRPAATTSPQTNHHHTNHHHTSASTVAATAPQPITAMDHLPAAGTATASLASQSFALLNQYLAGNSGRVDPGQIVAAVSQAAGSGQQTFLTTPQH